jgi:hypothetical protein
MKERTMSESSNMRRETREVRGFDEVVLSGTGALIIAQTGEESLAIEAREDVLPQLTSEVSGGRLTLGTKRAFFFRSTGPITYHVIVKDLKGISISGSGDATATGINTPEMRVGISGSGDISIAGQAQSQEVSISGSGKYRAGDFVTQSARITVSGAGNALVNASERLEVKISGAGDITYIGNPAIEQRVSGAGSIRRR